MTDALATQGGDTTSAPSAPVTAPAPEIERLRTEYEDRIKGFQRLVSERDSALADLQRKVADIELDRLPEDDRAKALARRAEEEVARLRSENELLRLRSEFPDEVPAFEKLLKAATPKEQLEVLRALARREAAQPSTTPEPPPVDPNNPMRQWSDETLVDGQPMTDELANRILSAAPKGSLFRRR